MATVCHTINTLDGGGIQELQLTLFKHSRHKHIIWSLHGGTMEAEMRHAGMLTYRDISMSPDKVDVLVCHGVGGWPDTEKCTWAKRAGAKTVEVIHSVANSLTNPEVVDCFVGVSQLTVNLNPQFARRINIYPPVDTSIFKRRWRTGANKIGRLSRLVPEKRPREFAGIARQLSEHQFLMAGGGSEREYIESVKPANLELVGWVRDFAQFYYDLDLYCYPTNDECACMSVAMAQAAGVPVICQDLPALRESTGGFALFCDSIPNFVAAIKHAETHYSAMLGQAALAQDYAVSTFGLENTVGRWDDLVSELVGENRE